MIVKNEADTLPNCLESVKGLFDEVVIVDTGSTDQTRECAKKFTDNVYEFDWVDDFSAARNYAFSLVASDYIMWLDADDVILPDDREKLEQLINTKLDGNLQMVAALYNVGFDERGKVNFQYYRERIFLRQANFVWKGRIHETIALCPNCLYSDFAVTHKKIHPTERGRNLRIFNKMKLDGETFDARAMFYYARELYYNGEMNLAADEFNNFLARPDGYIENKIDACKMLSYCLRATNKPYLAALFKSFEYDVPRAEICCEIGRHFFDLNENRIAVYWYNQALNCPAPPMGAFVDTDCYNFIPNIQLCVLHSRLGDNAAAVSFNEKAALFKPDSPAVLHNRKYFDSLKK